MQQFLLRLGDAGKEIIHALFEDAPIGLFGQAPAFALHLQYFR